MVAAISTPINPKTANQQRERGPPQNPKRTPLLPSESDNALAPRSSKAREVSSRYMSSSSSTSSSSSSSFSSTSSSISRRCHSPLVSRTLNNSTAMARQTPPPALTKRSQSAERRRPATPRPNSLYAGAGNGGGASADTPAAQKMLFTSTRSLSVSFQGESFSIQVSKAKPAPSPGLRKSTTERRKATTPARGGATGNSDQTENSRPVDQHRWPGTARIQRANSMSRSVDCEDARKKLGGPGNVVRSLQNLMADVPASLDGALRSETDNGQVGKKTTAEVVVEKRNKAGGSQLQPEPNIPSDNESVTSGSSGSSGAQECNGCGEGRAQRGSRVIAVPARFWQETNHRLRQQRDPGSPSSRNAGNKATIPPRLLAPKKSPFDSPVSSPRGVINSRGQVSPIRAAARPASPSKLTTPSALSPLRGVSPSRIRNGVTGGNLNNSLSHGTSILSFSVDLPRGKIGENRIVDAHLLKLLHNRLLQWRFVNARADAALSAQSLTAEKSLYDAWAATSRLRESVRAKRTELQLLKQQFKLISILKEQMIYLEDWAILDRVYSSSLSGAIEALKASTLRLPVVCGAKADVLNVKDAICSAVDVMQAMASSICLLLPKVGHVNSLVVEVANLSAKERALLDECKDLLSMITTMQVREFSVRTHISQLECISRSPRMKLTSK